MKKNYINPRINFCKNDEDVLTSSPNDNTQFDNGHKDGDFDIYPS